MGDRKIKQHYNKVLKDKEQRAKHFGKSGALGDEKEGREPGRVKEVQRHNAEAQEKLGVRVNIDDEMLRKLKKGEKVVLGR